MKRAFEFVDEKSHKFWWIESLEEKFVVNYGKIDSIGKYEIKELDNIEYDIDFLTSHPNFRKHFTDEQLYCNCGDEETPFLFYPYLHHYHQGHNNQRNQ